MDDKYIPEEDIPDRFWEFISIVNENIDNARCELHRMNKSTMIDLFRIFEDEKTEMNDVIALRCKNMKITENTIDDLSDALISIGKDTYLSVYYGKAKLPKREIWESLNTFGYLFYEIYYDRFNEEIDSK